MISNILQEQIGLTYIKKLAEPCTPFGKELINEINFYKGEDDLREEHDIVNQIADLGMGKIKDFISILIKFRNIRSSVFRFGNDQTLGLDEIYEIYRYFKLVIDVKNLCKIYSLTGKIRFSDYSEILSLLNHDGQNGDGFFITNDFSPKLARIRQEKRCIEGLLSVTDEADMKKILSRREKICMEEAEEEYRIRREISRGLKGSCHVIVADITMLAKLDLMICKAKLVVEHSAIFPIISNDMFLLEGMYSPEMEDTLNKQNKKFEPVSIEMKKGATVISGANMGGKSITLKLIALNVILAMWGWPVFCKRAVIPIISNVEIIADWTDNPVSNLSSFGNEMVSLKNIIEKVENSELILVDEPAKSTNPWEGTIIAKGITSFLNKQDLYSVITTHYEGVASLANLHYRTIGISHVEGGKETEEDMSFIIKNMKYGITLCPPEADIPREAINICKILGMPSALMREIISMSDK